MFRQDKLEPLKEFRQERSQPLKEFLEEVLREGSPKECKNCHYAFYVCSRKKRDNEPTIYLNHESDKQCQFLHHLCKFYKPYCYFLGEIILEGPECSIEDFELKILEEF